MSFYTDPLFHFPNDNTRSLKEDYLKLRCNFYLKLQISQFQLPIPWKCCYGNYVAMFITMNSKFKKEFSTWKKTDKNALVTSDFLKFFILIHRFIGQWKKQNRKISYTLYPVSLNANILHHYRIIANPRNWHWYNPHTLFLLYHSYLCVCIALCNFITFADLCNHYKIETVP